MKCVYFGTDKNPEDGTGSRRPSKEVRRCGKCHPAWFLFINTKETERFRFVSFVNYKRWP